MNIIYALYDPRQEYVLSNILYIGKTHKTLLERLSSHLKDAKHKNTKVYLWINSLVAMGLSPEIRPLFIVEDRDVNTVEIKTISLLKKLGCGLLNISRGGSGGCMPPEVIARAAQKLRGRSSWHKGVPMLKSSRLKLSQSLKGRIAWNKGMHTSEETKAKQRAAKLINPTRYWLGKKRHPSTIKAMRKGFQEFIRSGGMNGNKNHHFGIPTHHSQQTQKLISERIKEHWIQRKQLNSKGGKHDKGTRA